MRFTNLFSFLLLVLFATSACSTEQPPTTTVKLPMDRFEQDEILVFNIEQQVDQVFTAAEDSLVFDITEPTLIDIALGRAHNYVYLRPGDQLSLDTISSKPLVIAPMGDRSRENEYLLRLTQALVEDADRIPLRELGMSEPDSFLIKLEQKYTTSAEVLREMMADGELAADFKEAVNYYIMSVKGGDMMNYKYVYDYHHDTLPALSDDFYEPIASADLSTNTWLWFDDSRQLVSGWHSKDIDYSEFDSPTDYFAEIQKSAQSAYPGTLVGDYVEYSALSEFINFGNGIDNAGAAITNFQERVTNSYLLNQLSSTIEPWLSLKAGEPAPDFLVQDREGNPIKLADLAGQRVYVDVWATWCGPCIREIPALKELEEELHDTDVQFVSISIDAAKDHEKWLNFIQERELGGLQLMADGAWKSDVVEAYNIKGIPRFFIIDAEGKIVSADAPRPSDPSVKDVLLGAG